MYEISIEAKGWVKMIPYDVVLSTIEKHILEAKRASNENEIREKITAVKALCDIILLNNEQENTPLPRTQSSTSTFIQTSSKVNEEDANGDSIFDF